MNSAAIQFCTASSEADFDEIDALNYATFVEEIPQHSSNAMQRLRDRFHDRNRYILAKTPHATIGMAAWNTARPFSLEAKIGPLEKHLDLKEKKLCEIRLLAIDKQWRKGKVLQGLLLALVRSCLEGQIDMVLISATTRELKMYEHLGFIPFHPPVGKQGALFVPMYLDKNHPRISKWIKLCSSPVR